MTYDYKLILALAILMLPVSYCTLEESKLNTQKAIVCIEAGGDWTRRGETECKNAD